MTVGEPARGSEGRQVGSRDIGTIPKDSQVTKTCDGEFESLSVVITQALW